MDEHNANVIEVQPEEMALRGAQKGGTERKKMSNAKEVAVQRWEVVVETRKPQVYIVEANSPAEAELIVKAKRSLEHEVLPEVEEFFVFEAPSD